MASLHLLLLGKFIRECQAVSLNRTGGVHHFGLMNRKIYHAKVRAIKLRDFPRAKCSSDGAAVSLDTSRKS